MELLGTAPTDARREELADAVLRHGRAMFLCARSVLALTGTVLATGRES